MLLDHGWIVKYLSLQVYLKCKIAAKFDPFWDSEREKYLANLCQTKMTTSIKEKPNKQK